MVSLSREKERLQRKIRDQALTIHQLTVQVEAVMATPEATQVSDDMPWVWLEGRRAARGKQQQQLGGGSLRSRPAD